ncbi:hypothetical protein AADZ90_011680 [Aestuariibius sp. 2305UL40-4]|uniref:hypothetical protein n=1 Tax=Aestuariibius violaceus TaxID=3234132 RepID=UPI00345EB287
MISTIRPTQQSRAIFVGRDITFDQELPNENSLVGVDLDCEVVNNTLMVSASGTAVTIS